MKLKNYKTHNYKNEPFQLIATAECQYYGFYCKCEVYTGGAIKEIVEKGFSFPACKMKYIGHIKYKNKSICHNVYEMSKNITEKNIKELMLYNMNSMYQQLKNKNQSNHLT